MGEAADYTVSEIKAGGYIVSDDSTCAGMTCPAGYADKAEKASMTCTRNGEKSRCYRDDCCDKLFRCSDFRIDQKLSVAVSGALRAFYPSIAALHAPSLSRWHNDLRGMNQGHFKTCLLMSAVACVDNLATISLLYGNMQRQFYTLSDSDSDHQA